MKSANKKQKNLEPAEGARSKYYRNWPGLSFVFVFLPVDAWEFGFFGKASNAASFRSVFFSFFDGPGKLLNVKKSIKIIHEYHVNIMWKIVK